MKRLLKVLGLIVSIASFLVLPYLALWGLLGLAIFLVSLYFVMKREEFSPPNTY